MEKMPLFSVVIPLYNKADTILRALRSVFAQTLKDYEVVVIDDGSTDGSGDVVSRFGRDIRLVRQKNAGVSAARNRGVQESKGKYVAFLDGDDYWLPYHLSDLVAVLERYPTAKVISTRYGEIFDRKVLRVYGERTGIRELDFFKEFMFHEPIHSFTVAFERECFLQKGKYDSHYKFYEDAELYFRMANTGIHFYVNCRESVYHLYDSKESAVLSGKYRIPDYGHFHYAEECSTRQAASNAMARCVRRITKDCVYGAALHMRPEAVADFCRTYPRLRMQVACAELLSTRKWCLILFPWLVVRRIIVRIMEAKGRKCVLEQVPDVELSKL